MKSVLTNFPSIRLNFMMMMMIIIIIIIITTTTTTTTIIIIIIIIIIIMMIKNFVYPGAVSLRATRGRACKKHWFNAKLNAVE